MTRSHDGISEDVAGSMYDERMEELYSGHGWKLTLEEASLPDGRLKKSARVYRSDSVHIIALASPDTLVLIREFRPFYGTYIWMLPSGKADKETDVEETAHRELQEETGLDAKEMTFLFSGNYSEAFAMTNHIYLAKDLFESPLPQDIDELIEVHTLPIDEALQKILASPKVHLASAYGLLRYMREILDK